MAELRNGKSFRTFQSSIDKNDSLSTVDNFAYLRSLLVEPARSTIAGFALTSGNYAEAVEVFKKHCGKRAAIQLAHVNNLLNLLPVYNEKDTPRLRKLYDDCKAHFKGLKALGVEEGTFSAIVVPAIMQKFPEAFQLTITSGAKFLEWSMEEMLQAFMGRLELREDHFYTISTGS